MRHGPLPKPPEQVVELSHFYHNASRLIQQNVLVQCLGVAQVSELVRRTGPEALLAQIFWGLWLFPFGVVVMRSGFIPRALGPMVMIAGVGYVVSSMTALLLPALSPTVTPIGMALGVGEIPVFSYLQIWGARVRTSEAATLTTYPQAGGARG